MSRIGYLNCGLILSLLLASCGRLSNNMEQKPLCVLPRESFSEPLMSGMLYNLENNLCEARVVKESGQFKKITSRDESTSESFNVHKLKNLKFQSVEPRDRSLPIILKQAQIPSENMSVNFQAEQLSGRQLELLQSLISEIMIDYGSPQSDVGKIRALRDWVARTIIHPYSYFHIFSPEKNTSSLPEGKNWSEFYQFANNQKIYDDFIFLWSSFKLDGFKLLDYAIDLTGGNSSGIMEKISGSHYRLRSLEETTYYQCTPQAMILITLANALGYQGILISTIGHDTSSIYIPSLSKWIYEDATYNEDYIDTETGVILSPDELLEKSFEGTVFKSAIAVKNPGPSWDETVFLDFSDSVSATYFNEHPMGMTAMGSQLNGDIVDSPNYNIRLNQIMTPLLPTIIPFNDERVYARVLPQRAFPELGIYAGGFEKNSDGGYRIAIRANIPVSDLQAKSEGEEWKSIAGWQAGDSVYLPSDGNITYLRAKTPGELYTSTMIVQMP